MKTRTNNLQGLNKFLWWVFLIVSCGTLVGNPEEEESAGTQIKYRAEPEDLTPIKTSEGKAVVVLDKGLSILLTDAPVDDAKAVYITVKGVSVKEAGASWADIPVKEEKELNLLNLQNGDAILLAALQTLPKGTYDEIRLELSEASPARIILADDSEHVLTIPSGEESGLKIKATFEVSDEKRAVLVLDFDLRRSIHTTGGESEHGKEPEKTKGTKSARGKSEEVAKNEKDSHSTVDSEQLNSSKSAEKPSPLKYILKPVLRAVDTEKSGSITGKAADGEIVCVYKAGATADATSDCANAVTSARGHDGSFHLPYLPEEEYDIRVFNKDGKAKNYAKVQGKNGKKVEIVDE